MYLTSCYYNFRHPGHTVMILLIHEYWPTHCQAQGEQGSFTRKGSELTIQHWHLNLTTVFFNCPWTHSGSCQGTKMPLLCEDCKLTVNAADGSEEVSCGMKRRQIYLQPKGRIQVKRTDNRMRDMSMFSECRGVFSGKADVEWAKNRGQSMSKLSQEVGGVGIKNTEIT